MNVGARNRTKKLQRKGLIKMTESEAVKMAVVLVPVIWTVVVFLAGWIVEEVRNYKNRDLFKDEESQALLKKVKSE